MTHFKIKLMTEDTKEGKSALTNLKPWYEYSPAMKKTIATHNAQLVRFARLNNMRDKLWDVLGEHLRTGISNQLLKPFDSNKKFLQLANEVAIFLYKMFPNFTAAVEQESSCRFVYPGGEVFFPDSFRAYLHYSHVDFLLVKSELDRRGITSSFMWEGVDQFWCNIALQYSLIQQNQKSAASAATATAASAAATAASAASAVKLGGYFPHFSRVKIRNLFLPKECRK